MRKRVAAAALGLSLCLGLGACGAPAAPGGAPAPVPEASSAPESVLEEESVNARVRSLLEGMSTRQKLSQMMVVALRSGFDDHKIATEITPAYARLLQSYDFGGVLLFEGNMVNTAQTVTLLHDCQRAAMDSPGAIPMLFCVDQEGGAVNRVSFGVTGPGNMALSAAGDPALTEECADLLAREIRALGFRMDFAPVADVNDNPANPVIGVRSFSDDPVQAAEHVTAFLRGLNKNGVCAALKHFPGHGNVGEDSHTGLPSSPLTEEELMACELIPFQAGIDAGAEMIMTAHIQFPNIETGSYVSRKDGKSVFLPATLSHRILTELLREKLGFEGVIISDSMAMGAIAAHFDPIDAAVLAIRAGVDMLLCPVELYQDGEIDTLPLMDEYMRRLLERVESGEIRTEELDDSVARILKLKIEKGLLDEDTEPLEEKIARAEALVGSPEHHAREWEIAGRGLTLLKNEGGMLPLDGRSGQETLILIPSEYRRPTVAYALRRLEREGALAPGSVTVLNYSPHSPEVQEIGRAMERAGNVLILSQSPTRPPWISRLMESVQQKGSARVALLSLDLPYDAACYADADAILCAYHAFGSAHDDRGEGPFNLNVAAALWAVFGQSVPAGTLPVNIPRLTAAGEGEWAYSDELLYPRGSGLFSWGQ